MKRTTKEPQFERCVDAAAQRGFERLGLSTSHSWYEDPRHVLFHLARYKFVGKLLSGKARVLEVGCGDAFGTRIVQQEVEQITATDFDPVFVDEVKDRMVDRWSHECFVHDAIEAPIRGEFDAVYLLDVLEHIEEKEERRFLSNVFAPLGPYGVGIIGMPSLESQEHASPISREGHVNCKSQPDLKRLVEELFHNVFMFAMNDEVLHVGYHKMAHYLFAVGVGRRP